MRSFIRNTLLIASKELAIEWKTRQNISSMIIFAAIVMVVFGFSFEPTNNSVNTLIPGLIWIIIFFAGTLGINRSFASENKNDTLSALLIAPIPTSTIYLGKVIANYLILIIFEIITIPLLFLLFDFRFNGNILYFSLTLILGSLGFVIIGTFFAALTAGFKNNEMLFPILLFTMLIPVIIGAVQTTKIALIDVEGLSNALAWLKLISLYDFVFLTLALLLFDYLMEV